MDTVIAKNSCVISQAFEGLQYPLTLTFKLLALASQAQITDATGRTVLYTKQKMFKFKEHVEVWADSSQSKHLADIKANKVIDWSARYFFNDGHGLTIGSVGRKGWRSIWKAKYEAFAADDSMPRFTIQEGSSWVKVMDSIFGEIPILGVFAGYFFHPSYTARDANSQPIMTLTKQPAFFEGRFKLEKHAQIDPKDESVLVLSYLMLVMLERRRG